MDTKPFPNISYAQEAAISAHPSGANHPIHSNAYASDMRPSHSPGVYQGNHFHHHQYLPGSSYSASRFSHVDELSSLDSIDSQNAYPESSQRTMLHDSIPERAEFSRLATSFDAPLGNVARNIPTVASRNYGSFNAPPSSMNDRPHHIMSRSTPPVDTACIPQRRRSEHYVSAHFQGPSNYYQPSLSPVDFSTQRSASAGPPPSISQEHVSHILASMAHMSPAPSTSNGQSHPSGIQPTPSIPFQPSMLGQEHHHRQNPKRSLLSANPSIPMRKASAEWLTPTQGIRLSKSETQVDRFPSPALAKDGRPDGLSLNGRSGLSQAQQGARSPQEQSTTRTPSPHVAVATSQQDGSSSTSTPIPSEGHSGDEPPKKKKKSKMHTCEICQKKFPRPSGLRTHMNTHNNERPYPCGYPGCSRTFGVRSNAKRHLRTHGVLPASRGDKDTTYVVGFSTPLVGGPPDVHASSSDQDLNGDTEQAPHRPQVAAKPPFFKLRWMPQSLTNRNNAAALKPVSEDGDFSDEDEEDGDHSEDPDSTLVIRKGSRDSMSSTASQLNGSSSNTSLSASPPGCICAIPCARTPCLSWATSPNQTRSNYNPSGYVITGGGRESGTDSYLSSKAKVSAAIYEEPNSYPPSQDWVVNNSTHRSLPAAVAV